MKLKKICWHYPAIYSIHNVTQYPKVRLKGSHQQSTQNTFGPTPCAHNAISALRTPSKLYEFFVWFSTCCVITLFFVCCFFFTLGFWCLAEWICCCDISRDRLAWFHGNPFPSTKTPILHSFYSRFFLLFISLFLFNCEIPPLSFVLSLLLKRIK